MSSDVRWNVYYNVGFGKSEHRHRAPRRVGRKQSSGLFSGANARARLRGLGAVNLVSSSRGREARRVPQKMDPRLRGDDKWVRGAKVGRASAGVAVVFMAPRCGRGGVVGRDFGSAAGVGVGPVPRSPTVYQGAPIQSFFPKTL